MKKLWVILFLFLFCSFSSASINVYNYSIQEDYFLEETIKGDINLSINNGRYDDEIFFGKQSAKLETFLRDNGAVFNCSPSDCSMSYDFSSKENDKIFDIDYLKNSFVGFVLYGENVVLDSISFKVESDFVRGNLKPLSIEFFEEENWNFNVFSDEYLGKRWGCFNPVFKQEGSLIGNSFYCETIGIEDSGTLRVGADVIGSGDADLKMTVYPESGTGVSWECSYNPNSDSGCEVSPDLGDIFSAGDYYVCVGATSLTDYRIYEESKGETCGFVYDSGLDSVKDYGIFAQGAKYENASYIGDLEFSDDILYAANDLITSRYDGNCLDGCVLPLKFSGVSQNARVYDVNLVYTKNGEWDSDNSVYNLQKSAAEVDFNGSLDLGLLGFVALKAGDFIIKLGEDVLFEGNMSILPSPVILSVSPLNPPASVPINFYTLIDYGRNDSLIYNWDFGDGKKGVSSVPFITHTYDELKNYSLSLNVSAGGNLTSHKTFNINTISPEVAVGKGLNDKMTALDKVRLTVNGLPSWFSGVLKKTLKLDILKSDLERLEKERNNSVNAENFRKVAIDLYSLDLPVVVGANSFDVPFLMTELSDIDVEPVAIISGKGSASNDEYTNPVLTWQSENIDASFSKKQFFVSYWSDRTEDLLSVYSFKVKSRYDRESYFVINKLFEKLYFKESVGARKAGDATVISLKAGEEKEFEFYYEGGEDVGFFVSPKLSSLVIEANINEDCNFNFICEKDKGENPDNCRTDCKPIGKAVLYFILGFILLLCIYTGLQVWYKKRYEGYLFKDKTQMYNLLMFVTNARARGLTDLRIEAELRKKGWSSERVNYIIKKSRGDKMGMFEIIPVEKIMAYFRNLKAKRAFAAKQKGGNQKQLPRSVARVATGVQRNNNGNINKS